MNETSKNLSQDQLDSIEEWYQSRTCTEEEIESMWGYYKEYLHDNLFEAYNREYARAFCKESSGNLITQEECEYFGNEFLESLTVHSWPARYKLAA